MFDSLIFGAYDWWWLAALLAGIGCALVMWSYLGKRRITGSGLIAMLLKCLAIIAIAFCLLQPQLRLERPRPGANLLAVVVDDSRSMQIRAAGSKHGRADNLRPWLNPESAWQTRAAQDFEVRRYRFDQHLQPATVLSDLAFSGQHSSLAGAMSTLQSRFTQRNVAGVLLFTDGLATDDMQRLLETSDFPFPIYPVLENARAATTSLPRDLALSRPSVSVSPFELAPARVEARLSVTGLDGKEVAVSLLAADGGLLEQQRINVAGDRFEQQVRFQFQPSEAGLQFVELRAQLSSEMPAEVARASATVASGRGYKSLDLGQSEIVSRTEVTTANNHCALVVDRGGGPYRILYVSGRPNWEFKFIRRALEEDVELKFHGLVRIAKKEAKFNFRDQVVESANPLKAGFSDDEETVERYDEPVLLKFGEGAAEALGAGFPSGAESLFAYHAIILDDVEAQFFTQQQMLLMRQFVAERGGGLMMLGGQESFLGGGYRDTPLGEVLPVYLQGQEASQNKSLSVRYGLTRAGALEPWLRLRSVQADEVGRFEEMPKFLTWNTVSGIKPGAVSLAEIRGGEHEGDSVGWPALVSQRFGRGRTMALMVGDFWRWSMRRTTLETDDLAQSWRQMARWLTSDVPRGVQIEIASPTDTLQPHRLTVTLRDPAYQPLDNGHVELAIVEPNGQRVELQALPDSDRRGQYVADYWSSQDGGYRCEVFATGPDGAALERVVSGWTAQPSAAEFAHVEANTALLEQLAEASGGEVVELAQLDSWIASLPTRRVPVTEVRIEPLWHQPWLIVLAIGCLCIEWGLRRWKGLA